MTRAFGVSSNGRLIVGDGDDRTGNLHPVLWVPGGVLDLGIAGNYQSGRAKDMSDDGQSAVINFTSNTGLYPEAAGIWTSGTWPMLAHEFLALHGIGVPAGMWLTHCEAISADGRTFAGNARYRDATGRDVWTGWVATVPGAMVTVAFFGLFMGHRSRP